jgi:hypothetical protein
MVIRLFERVDADADRFAGDRGLGFVLVGAVDILGLVVLRPARLALTCGAGARSRDPACRGTPAPVHPARLRPEAAAVPRSRGTNVPTVVRRTPEAAGCTLTLPHHLAELMDQVGFGAFRLALVGFKLGEDLL